MCLEYNDARTQDEIKFNRQGFAILYKFYEKRGKELFNPYSCLHGMSRPISYGWIFSNRDKQAVGEDGWDHPSYYARGCLEIRRGIHCFTTKKQCLYTKHGKDVLVLITVQREDLVVAQNGEAVFMKVFLPKKAYKKALSL